MLHSILNKSKTLNSQSPSSLSPLMNPQKPTQKTSQSSQHQKDQPSLQQYSKLQQLLQSRQAALREHAKHEYQLKLFIEDLEEKNRALEKNCADVLGQYKAEVTVVRRENEGLRRVVKKLEAENVQLKRQIQAMLGAKSGKPQSADSLVPVSQHHRAQSESVIKVIQSVDHKQSVRQSNPNFRLSAFTLSGKESPILPSQESRRNVQSQSKQKLQVTMKSSRFLEKVKSSTPGRNQKHSLGQGEGKGQESVVKERSIKKLMELRKMNEGSEEEMRGRKMLVEKGSAQKGSVQKRIHPHISNQNSDQLQGFKSNERSSAILDQLIQEKIVIKDLSKDLKQQMKRSLISGNSQQLSSRQEKRSKHQMSRGKQQQNELIKLGHYGNVNTERGKYQKKGDQ